MGERVDEEKTKVEKEQGDILNLINSRKSEKVAKRFFKGKERN